MSGASPLPADTVVRAHDAGGGRLENATAHTSGVAMLQTMELASTLRAMLDPWTCRAEELPVLAWAWSVDIWDDAWPEHVQRKVIAESPHFHELKTTIAGIRKALGYRGAQLIRSFVPRQAFWAGRAPSVAEHTAWLARLPEIRILPPLPQRTAKQAGRFVGASVWGSAAEAQRDLTRLVYLDGGRRRPVIKLDTVRDAHGRLLKQVERFAFPIGDAGTLHAGRPGPRFCARGGRAIRRIATVRLSDREPAAFVHNAFSAGLVIHDVTPILRADPLPDVGGVFCGRPRSGRGCRRNRAAHQLYRSIRLDDGSSIGQRRRTARNAIGRSRVRRRPFTQEFQVYAPQDPRKSLLKWMRFAGSAAAAEAAIAELAHAIGAAQAHRDVSVFSTNVARPIRFGDADRLPADATFGLSIID